ncbi:MAG: DUF1848 family protein [Desulfobacterales bacterium]|jgi:hypothetical protein
MNPKTKIVISASRRTDIPAFYMPWFMACIDRGVFEVVNPFNRKVKVVPATPADVHTIVLWSKDFGLFLKRDYGKKLQKAGYHLFFNFTLNSASPQLESRVPPLDDRLDQLRELGEQFGPSSINWRFDPVCFYEMGNGRLQDNLGDLGHIAAKAAAAGIRRCISSFMDPYSKIKRRLVNRPDFSFRDPPLKTRLQIIRKMERILASENIKLGLCCEKEVLDQLPASASVTRASCIPNDLLVALFGGRLSLKRDTGQRIKNGCGCRVSVDIGAYHQHPCYHNCLYCYANPTSK